MSNKSLSYSRIMFTADEYAGFFSRAIIPSMGECWEWTGWKPSGRGKLRFRRRSVNASRMAYLITAGEIPDGLSVLHTCNNGNCVNPLHLYLGTQLRNIADMVAAGRHARGERHGKAKLSEAAVLRANELQRELGSYSAVGILLGVDRKTIKDALTGKTWKHLVLNQ